MNDDTVGTRQRCWCGAFAADASEELGIDCESCGEVIPPSELRLNGYEWTGEVWALD